MAERKQRPAKGGFGGVRLPIARQYLSPERRSLAWQLGAIGAVAVGLALLVTALLGSNRALSPGPLSSAHASFEADCSACHGPFRGVADQACLTCHERVGLRQGLFSFASHYAYGSGRRDLSGEPGRELPCAGCHLEHGGRGATLVTVPNPRCASCHGFSSFERGHPQFVFAREGRPDANPIRFSHRHHVAEVLARQVATEPAAGNPQLACLYCHSPDPEGAGFAPLAFERHCGACHLTGGEETPALPVRDPGRPLAPGLETLEQIQARRGPGTRWAFFTNPEELTVRGGRVGKSPLNHADPWVLENLATIRRTLYPELGLAGLLRSSPGEGAAPEALYREAWASLEAQATELRDRPELAGELEAVEATLRQVERRLLAGEGLDAAPFFQAGAQNPALTPAAAEEWRRLALELARPCTQCHEVRDAALLRVDAGERTLARARFHHRAHVLERPLCTACHGAIPDLFGERRTPAGDLEPEPLDLAATQNLPAIETCRECHNTTASSDACTTCHLFHPDSGFRADLLIFRPSGESGGPGGEEGRPASEGGS